MLFAFAAVVMGVGFRYQHGWAETAHLREYPVQRRKKFDPQDNTRRLKDFKNKARSL